MPDASEQTPTTTATNTSAQSGAPAATAQPSPMAVQQIALQEVQALMLATGNLVTTVSALMAAALGFVAALAWNKAIQDWLSTADILNIDNPLVKEFAYAIAVTLFAAVIIAALSVINRRIKGRNLLKELSK
ncbi:MAG TPA: DUF5654 family protein [Ktedonobacterales bacterium]